MTPLLEILEIANVEVESRDGSLTTRMSGSKGIEVHIRQMSYHDDETLITQLRQALSEATRAFHEACDAITTEADAVTGTATDTLTPDQRGRLNDYLSEVTDIGGSNPLRSTRTMENRFAIASRFVSFLPGRESTALTCDHSGVR